MTKSTQLAVTGTRNVQRRFALGFLPAIGITGGLFLAMAGLIAVDFKPAEAEPTRLIPAITPAPVEETKIDKRPKPKPLESVEQPAPPPTLSVSKSAIDLPKLDFPPVIPEIKTGPVQVLTGAPISIADDDVRPIQPPIVTYPPRALNRGIEGSCSVSMHVTAKGRPYNVSAVCTDRIFQAEAVRAVSRVEFRPKIVDSVAVERKNVVYPLTFTLQD